MSTHKEALRRMLDPEAFEDFQRRCEGILQMREEIADEFRDIYPPGVEYTSPEAWAVHPWMVNWVRRRGRFDLETWDATHYQILVEALFRYVEVFRLGRKFVKEKPSVDELITTKWVSFLSSPPTFVVRADLSFSSNQLLYGKYATSLVCGADYWRGEFSFCSGWHMEDGVPVTMWVVGFSENVARLFTDEDLFLTLMLPEISLPPGVMEIVKKYMPDLVVPIESYSKTPKGTIIARYNGRSREVTISDEDTTKMRGYLPLYMNRRHLRLGIKLKEMPKKRPYFVPEWVRPVRDICMDLREEMFAKWAHATLYILTGPGMQTVGTMVNFWGMSQWWNDPWYALNAMRVLGHGQWLYSYEPLPPILNTLLALPLETWKRRLSQLYFSGPQGMICDPVCKLCSPENRTPLIHDIRRIQFDEGKMYKGYALPYDDGIPPPPALLTALPVPLFRETNVKDFFTNPDSLSKEYWEFLESEGGVDKKTGRIPPYSEVPRLKWLFDPTIEWLKSKDFPPIDWSEGQVWPFDITREKMEIMVEEGYDGSGKNILHYSALADKKMGKEGKTILLGTMPYKLPTE